MTGAMFSCGDPHASAAIRTSGYQATMGIAPDLMTCSKMAVRAMIDWLVSDRGLTRDDAYKLCSITGDLKIIEVVDSGVWTVSMSLPLEVFEAE